MKTDKWLNGTAIHAALRSWFAHHNAQGKEIRRNLYRLPGGQLTFMDGTPVRRGELMPGTQYSVIEMRTP